MNHYYYKALDSKGDLVKGVFSGADIPFVQGALAARGYYVLQIKEASRLLKIIEEKRSARGIKRKDIIELSSNMGIMLRAGIPLLAVLEEIINTVTNEHLKSAIIDVKKNTEMGVRFSQAIEFKKAVFPDIMINLLKVGEETGRLDQSFEEIALHLQKVEDLAATVKRAMIYPIFSLITAGGAVIFWLAYVLPQIMKVIIGMGVKMPFLTKMLYNLSKITEKYWYIAIIVPIFTLILVKLMKYREYTKHYLDLTMIKLPIVKTLLHNRLLALMSEQFRLLITAGVTIDRSFDITADVMGNEVFRRAILAVKEEVMAGTRIADALRKHSIFPPLFTRMVSIGESSGNLDQQFGFLADYYYKVVNDFSEKIGKVMEPIMLIVIGLIMAVMIAGVLLPMYDVFTKLS